MKHTNKASALWPPCFFICLPALFHRAPPENPHKKTALSGRRFLMEIQNIHSIANRKHIKTQKKRHLLVFHCVFNGFLCSLTSKCPSVHCSLDSPPPCLIEAAFDLEILIYSALPKVLFLTFLTAGHLSLFCFLCCTTQFLCALPFLFLPLFFSLKAIHRIWGIFAHPACAVWMLPSFRGCGRWNGAFSRLWRSFAVMWHSFCLSCFQRYSLLAPLRGQTLVR